MMHNQASLQETKQHGAVRFPFNLYPVSYTHLTLPTTERV